MSEWQEFPKNPLVMVELCEEEILKCQTLRSYKHTDLDTLQSEIRALDARIEGLYEQLISLHIKKKEDEACS